jgi:hypothetical protein
MKKLFNVIVLTLAVNFLAVAGAVVYLRADGRINRERVFAIKEILFPAPATQPSEHTTRPADPTTQPLLRLEELLSKQTGRSAAEQVEFIRHTFDAQMAQLDRRQRELSDLQRQVDLAKEQLARDRSSLGQQKGALEAREQEAARLESDKGFQDSLAMYKSLPGKQVKSIFMTLDDKLVGQYLRAMEPRASARIVKEFKSPEEAQFIQKVMERIRQQTQQQQASSASPASSSPPTGGSKEKQ